jgi:hypothetical protein
MKEETENLIAVIVLSTLSLIYIYVLLSPSQVSPPFTQRRFAIPRFPHCLDLLTLTCDSDTKADFELFMAKKDHYNDYNGSFGFQDWDRNYSINEGGVDDFFLPESQWHGQEMEHSGPIVPSDHYVCANGWVAFRSEASNHPLLSSLSL